MAEATAERLELADLLDTLTPEQWAAPSLCARWTVRDVVAHVVSYEGLGVADLGRLAARGLGSPDRMNALALAALAGVPAAELVDRLRTHARPSGLTAGFGGGIGLTDTLVHHQDVRRPLGLARVVPPERLRFALGFTVTAPTVRGAWHARAVRLVATDVDWSHGRGPEARGPGEAVLMALAGRAGSAADLTGPGADRLRHRHG